MTQSLLCDSMDPNQHWIIPIADGKFKATGILSAGMNYAVEQAHAHALGTNTHDIKAFKVAGGSDGVFYVYYLYRNKLEIIKVDGSKTTTVGSKTFSDFYLATAPNNRKSFDYNKVKDILVTGNGRVLHIIYADSSAVWYDIYEYDSGSEFTPNWVPINTNIVHADYRGTHDVWGISSNGAFVAIAAYSASTNMLALGLFQGTAGDHTNVQKKPHQFYKASVTEEFAPIGIMVSDNGSQIITTHHSYYRVWNVTGIDSNTSTMTVSDHKVVDNRVNALHFVQWHPAGKNLIGICDASSATGGESRLYYMKPMNPKVGPYHIAIGGTAKTSPPRDISTVRGVIDASRKTDIVVTITDTDASLEDQETGTRVTASVPAGSTGEFTVSMDINPYSPLGFVTGNETDRVLANGARHIEWTKNGRFAVNVT